MWNFALQHQSVQVNGLSKFHVTVHCAHTVWGHTDGLLLAPVGACVSALIWVMLPACQCRSSSLVLCCAAMILLEPAVRSILWSKRIHSLILRLSIAPLVQLLHQDILTQNRCILLIATLGLRKGVASPSCVEALPDTILLSPIRPNDSLHFLQGGIATVWTEQTARLLGNLEAS